MKKDKDVIILKNFYFESKARLYIARLEEAGIPAFLSNVNTTTFIPFGHGGITLHIRKKDARQALEIIKELDAIESGEKPSEETFHDAEKEDILFEKEAHAIKNRRVNSILLFITLFLLSLFLLRIFFRAAGYFEWFDYF